MREKDRELRASTVEEKPIVHAAGQWNTKSSFLKNYHGRTCCSKRVEDSNFKTFQCAGRHMGRKTEKRERERERDKEKLKVREI